MLGLPKTTELNKQLSKRAIYAKFQMNGATRERLDADVAKITIVNELTPGRTNLAVGKEITSFYVLLVSLKRKNFAEKSIATIARLIPQNILMILQYEKEAKLAVYRAKLIQTEWKPADALIVELKGLNFDQVWTNLIQDIEGGSWDKNLTLDENIAQHEQQVKIQKEIERLEKMARVEKQPRKAFELVQRINQLKKELI